MSALDAVRAIEEGFITEEEALEMSGCVSLLELYDEATKAEERQRWREMGKRAFSAGAPGAF